MLDIAVVLPQLAILIAKLANGIVDTPALMAISKSICAISVGK
jgi:phosphopantothenoylcysteine synthetase/decarboxylase